MPGFTLSAGGVGRKCCRIDSQLISSLELKVSSTSQSWGIGLSRSIRRCFGQQRVGLEQGDLSNQPTPAMVAGANSNRLPETRGGSFSGETNEAKKLSAFRSCCIDRNCPFLFVLLASGERTGLRSSVGSRRKRDPPTQPAANRVMESRVFGHSHSQTR